MAFNPMQENELDRDRNPLSGGRRPQPGAELTMRWIDIILPEPGADRRLDEGLEAVAQAMPDIHAIQERDGVDAVTVTAFMARLGRELFQAVTAALPDAFNPDPTRAVAEFPALDQADHDDLLGFHLVVSGPRLRLPWTWLHNGLDFLLVKHPVCAASHRASCRGVEHPRPWMQRLTRAAFLVGENGETSLPAVCSQLRPHPAAMPEVLFVPGHADAGIRRLIFREAEAIAAAMGSSPLGPPLARLKVPSGAVTPGDLTLMSLAYQAMHYAGPTSAAGQYDASMGEYWMNRLMEEAAQMPEHHLEELAGMEGEVLGVDPITSLLDDIGERYDRRGGILSMSAEMSREAGGSAQVRPAGGDRRRESGGWLLDDGPMEPERFALGGGIPPLVFSNSYCGLYELGDRFTSHGASTFIGPVAPLFSRPARQFAGHCYAALSNGWSCGAALWRAAADIRDEYGAEHPAWLSYGIQGYGSLALQYL